MSIFREKAGEFLESYTEALRIRDGDHKREIIAFAAAFAESLVRQQSKEISQRVERLAARKTSP